MQKLSVFISTCFGIGFFPKAPGTVGTLFAALVYYFLPKEIFSTNINNMYFLLTILGISIAAVFITSKAEKTMGHDNGSIVLDEFVGYMISVAFLPKSFIVLIGAFILFRIFDILKPEPVDSLQRLPKGLGVVVDDLMAGIYANLILQIIFFFKPNLFLNLI